MFKSIMMQKLVDDWEGKKKKMKNANAVALVTADGHSTRLQPEIWEKLKQHNMIVMCKPAHTSNVTSALDAAPNGKFKYHMQEVPPFPKQREVVQKLPKFVECVAHAVYKALDPNTIKAGFCYINMLVIIFLYL
jgi:hypothetical protein